MHGGMEHWSDGKGRDGLVVPEITRSSVNPFIDEFDPLEYWLLPERVAMYPHLCVHAQRIQVVMCSSNICERVRALYCNH